MNNTIAHKILIVDDEPDLEYLIKQKFRKKIRENKYEFFTAYNGVEALEVLKNNKEIDLILTDINMPEMDGLSLLGKIRELNNPLLKSVVVSAYGDMENIRTAMNRGAFDFITKPINFDDLEITINKTLEEISLVKESLESRDNLLALQQELEVAKSIQLSILPKNFSTFSDQALFDIEAFIETAKEVGGDFYDFFMIDDQKLGIVIGDVSGKGVPAAIFMAVSKTILKTTAMRNIPAHDCIQIINQSLCNESVATMYVTAFFGILNIYTGELEYCNAGHNTPYLLKKNGKSEQLESTGGIPLGYLDDFIYENKNIKIQPEETIIFYTDGVTEAMDIDENEFSETRLEQSLEKYSNSSLSELREGIVGAVKTFTKNIPQSDDITLLIVKLKEKVIQETA